MKFPRKLLFIFSIAVCLAIIVYLAGDDYAAPARHFLRNLVRRLF
jgi:hypothetical protein